LAQGVFTQQNPQAIAASLKRSAERSHRRKSGPYRSALSMLTFYINRAGKNLPRQGARRCSAQRSNCENNSAANKAGGLRLFSAKISASYGGGVSLNSAYWLCLVRTRRRPAGLTAY
jgi:hypothetical protein